MPTSFARCWPLELWLPKRCRRRPIKRCNQRRGIPHQAAGSLAAPPAVCGTLPDSLSPAMRQADKLPACPTQWWLLKWVLPQRLEGFTMRTPNECWMDLHRLAASLDAEGLTRQERFDNLVEEFLQLPPLVRRELIAELRFLLSELPDLERVIIQATNVAEEKKKQVSKTG